MNDAIIQQRYENFITKAKLRHGDQFTYDRLTWNGLTGLMKIICVTHGVFDKKPAQHLNQKYSCPQCDSESKGKWNTKPRDIYFADLKTIHGDTYVYRPEQYINTKSMLTIKCVDHGDFIQLASAHFSGQGCPECGKWKAGKTRTVSFSTFMEKSKSAHGDKFEYFEEFWQGMEIKTKVKCSQHGIFDTHPRDHVESMYGCYHCALIQTGLNHRTSDETLMAKLLKQKPDYEYLRIYRDSSRNNKPMIEIKCPDHGPYVKGYHKWIKHTGFCPECFKGKQYSILEREWLTSLNIDTLIFNYRLPNLKTIVVDGYDPITNTVYQFHGNFFHGHPWLYNPDDINPKTKISYGEAYKKTLRIAAKIRSAGFNLVEKWETDITEVLAS